MLMLLGGQSGAQTFQPWQYVPIDKTAQLQEEQDRNQMPVSLPEHFLFEDTIDLLELVLFVCG